MIVNQEIVDKDVLFLSFDVYFSQQEVDRVGKK